MDPDLIKKHNLLPEDVARIEDEEARELQRSLAALAGAPLTDERILDIRDKHLPNRGDSSDCIDFVRECLAAASPVRPEPAIPSILFDGYAVLQALSKQAKSRTSGENVADTLDAVVRLLLATPTGDTSEEVAS